MTNLQATTTAPKKIVITWDSAVGEDFSHYNVYRTMSKILPYTYLAKTTSNSYEDLLNSNGPQRYYKVTVVAKARRTGPWSDASRPCGSDIYFGFV